MPPETWILLGLIGLAVVIWLVEWLACRLTAARCPRCGSKWQTENLGEWDGCAAWQCHRCAKYWNVFYFRNRS